VTIAPFGASIPYYFTGHEGPDSCCIDSDDNLYVAWKHQMAQLSPHPLINRYGVNDWHSFLLPTMFFHYSTNLKGGVYYVSPDFKSITPVIQNLAVANGVALSTDEKTLWVLDPHDL
jgi:sugar lactone lactonase YvrE